MERVVLWIAEPMNKLIRLLGMALTTAGAMFLILMVCSPATAHEGEKHDQATTEPAKPETNPIGDPAKEAQIFAQKLRRPEYVHVLLNPIPVYGSVLGAVALAAALLLKSKRAMAVAMLIVLLSTGAAWPVLWLGERAYDQISPNLQPDAKQWLDLHMERGEAFIYAFYVTALLAAAGMIAARRPKVMTVLAVLTLAGAVVCAALGAWIAHAGGQVMHSELREGPPPMPLSR